jgi:Dolichyl-phosphate-mannose-protein mannosyltransferase
MPTYFGVDNVNLALALEKFDPRIHQPQPPGYPFFVALAKSVNYFAHDAAKSFLIVSVSVSALCLVTAYLLAARMFSRTAGAVAALLLLVNPVFWYASLDPNGGPLRPFLGLFSLLVAYCCWRCWNGEKQFALWGAIALGIGSGFRPDLIAFLFPLWLLSTRRGTKSWQAIGYGLVVLSVIVFVWVGALVVAMGGVSTFMSVMFNYAVDQAKPESVVLGSSVMAWLRQMNRLVVWNGLAIVTWIWALPFYLASRDRIRIGSSQGAFFFVWLVPGLIVQALIHVAAPGHTLYSVAAFCLLGGYVLSIVPAREVMVGAALVMNVMLFLDFFPLPANTATGERVPSIKNVMLFGTFESSIGEVHFLDDITRTTLTEIEEFTPKDRPSIIVTTDTYRTQWFMNWRIGRYYLPERDLWVLYNDQTKKRVERVRRGNVLDASEMLRVPVSRQARILWVIEPESEMYKQVAAAQKLSGGKYVFYSDVTADSPAFTIDHFEIVPSL